MALPNQRRRRAADVVYCRLLVPHNRWSRRKRKDVRMHEPRLRWPGRAIIGDARRIRSSLAAVVAAPVMTTGRAMRGAWQGDAFAPTAEKAACFMWGGGSGAP